MEEYISRLSSYSKPNLKAAKELTSAEYYYDPHSHLNTHECFINDHFVVSTYQGWIKDNERFIKDKVVLDVGAGTGLLSLFAAKAGAHRVISIEWSNIAEQMEQVVKINGFEKVISVIRANVEDAELPDGITTVDTIISAWPNFCLFTGGRLKSVFLARNKWLKKDGAIIPDRADVFICGISDADFKENTIDAWENVYGFNMSSVIDDALIRAQITRLQPDKIATNMCRVKSIDLRMHSYNEVMKEVPFMLTATRNDFMQGYCVFFTVTFSYDLKKREISTDPRTNLTHWLQTCFYSRDYFRIRKKEKIQGSFSLFGINNDPRYLGVIIGSCFKGEDDETFSVKTYVVRP